MPHKRRSLSGLLLGGVVLALGGVYISGLGSYGLWEPWELDRIEDALGGEEGDQAQEAPAGASSSIRPSSKSFDEIVITSLYTSRGGEGGLRLAEAVLAVLSLILALILGAALFDIRSSIYAVVLLAGMPLFIVSARLLVCSPLPTMATTLVLGGAALSSFGPFRNSLNAGLGGAAVALGTVIGYFSAGPVLGALGPLLGAGLGLAMARVWRLGKPQLLVLVALVVALATVAALNSDALTIERSRTDTSFIVVLKQVLIGTFPWTGLIAVGLSVLAIPDLDEERKGGAAGILLAGVAVALTVHTLWSEQPTGFPALWPLAIGAGLFLTRVDTDDKPRRIGALICALFLLLGLRDHVLEPQVLLVSLGASVDEFPAELPAKIWFGLVTVLVGVPLVLGLAVGGERSPGRYLDWLRRIFGWLWPFAPGSSKVIWVAFAVVMLLLLNGIITAVAPNILWLKLLSCLERRIWIAAGLFVPAMIVLALISKVLWDGAGLILKWRGLLVAAVGGLVTVLSVHVALPTISRHYSNREVLRAYERLAEEDSPLVAYKVSTRSTELLTEIERRASMPLKLSGPRPQVGPEIETVTSVEKIVAALTSPRQGKSFALIKGGDLARVDVAYRKRTRKHVPVVDRTNSSSVLLASQLAAKLDRNPLRAIVLDEPPSPQFPVRANFEDRIELLGIDLEGPGGRQVLCPAESFKITYYWYCTGNISGSKEIFVHIDGSGLRINGDHKPANELYLVNDWQPGDYIVDEQELRVPMHFRPGDYTIYVGFFQGSNRMEVKSGPATRDNRVKAGILKVR